MTSTPAVVRVRGTTRTAEKSTDCCSLCIILYKMIVLLYQVTCLKKNLDASKPSTKTLGGNIACGRQGQKTLHGHIWSTI